MTKPTYLNSAYVADILCILGNAFLTYRNEIDEKQSRNNCYLEDAVMDVILQHNVIADNVLHPLVRILINAAIAEPALYTEWADEDADYFSEQLELNLFVGVEIPL